MPLQNRVTPLSAIEYSSARGMLTGNRGILHGDGKNLLTQGWRTQGWINCSLEYRGSRRKLMTPGTWTELFFLDEPTALAAGHRPCALCRRAAYKQFMAAAGFERAKDLDAVLHAERVARLRGGVRRMVNAATLPDNAFVLFDGICWRKLGPELLAWSHSGYTERRAIENYPEAELITAPVIVAALQNGYHPVQFEGHV